MKSLIYLVPVFSCVALLPAQGAEPPEPDARRQEILRRFDKNQSGRLESDERRAALAWLREHREELPPPERPPLGPPGQGFPPPGGFPGFGNGRRGQEGPAPEPSELTFEDGVARIPDRETFKKLSYQGEDVMIDTHLRQLEYVKFALIGAGTDSPKLYFMNTQNHRAHPMFLQAMGIPFRFGRGGEDAGASGTTMLGVLVYRPLLGAYTFEFEPNDAYSFELVKFAHDILVEHGPIFRDRLSYHPLNRAIERAEREKEKYAEAKLNVFLPDALYRDIAYLPLHAATGFGRLRLMRLDERPGPRDVVIYRTLPNEMPRVAGVMTGVRQTPLSHVNLRAIQDNVPNAFIKGVADDPKVLALVGRYVQLVVAPDGYTLREASAEEVEAHFAALRPSAVQRLSPDLSVQEIRPLKTLALGDQASVGVKAANLGVLQGLGLPVQVPKGFAIPFSFYDAFMAENGLAQAAQDMMAVPRFHQDADFRVASLTTLRKQICAGVFSASAMEALAALQASFPADQPLRCRSSTNNEDLPGFSGAGLYDSFTHRPDEGHLAKTIKEVFASLWNFRAFEEREFFRVDHLTVKMGVLVHPNFDDERANGVAVSEDVVYQTPARYYVNTQLGEDLVTNPDSESLPEELLLGRRSGRVDTVIQRSTRVAESELLLTDEHRNQLRLALRLIHQHFRDALSPEGRFAMEVEFKVDRSGTLVIKQARPWAF